ncbi:MAG: hypothetical protein PHY93_03900 [Bacteriovorax sp.]|nr:hypothetical protein [Bacteriovorax sp.]
MKQAILFLSLVLGLSANASDLYKNHGGTLPNCPNSQTVLLEVVSFKPSLPSADSRISNGTCKVLAPHYAWYDLIQSSEPFMEEINGGNCNPDNFKEINGKIFISAILNFKGKVSRCDSNPGCYYACTPTNIFLGF